MASYGSRPTGTDGLDFIHRERVAGHYHQSVTNKFRLKLSLILHLVMYLMMFARTTEQFLDWIHVDWAPLERLNFPDPQLWEYLWLLTFIPVFCMFASLSRNREQLMRRAYYGLFCLGVLPLVIAAGSNLPEIWRFIRDTAPSSAASRQLFLGFPLVVLQYMFVAVALQIHLFSLYYAAQLCRAWKPRPKVERPTELSKQDTVILNEPKKKR